MSMPLHDVEKRTYSRPQDLTIHESMSAGLIRLKKEWVDWVTSGNMEELKPTIVSQRNRWKEMKELKSSSSKYG
eukprot:scaffold22166_cov214-Skeletonema_dohrnii-CCMP3373.AAC.1